MATTTSPDPEVWPNGANPADETVLACQSGLVFIIVFRDVSWWHGASKRVGVGASTLLVPWLVAVDVLNRVASDEDEVHWLLGTSAWRATAEVALVVGLTLQTAETVGGQWGDRTQMDRRGGGGAAVLAVRKRRERSSGREGQGAGEHGGDGRRYAGDASAKKDWGAGAVACGG